MQKVQLNSSAYWPMTSASPWLLMLFSLLDSDLERTFSFFFCSSFCESRSQDVADYSSQSDIKTTIFIIIRYKTIFIIIIRYQTTISITIYEISSSPPELLNNHLNQLSNCLHHLHQLSSKSFHRAIKQPFSSPPSVILLFLLLQRSQLYLWGSPFWVRCLCMWQYFNPTIEVVTFHLRGWCMLGVFLLPAFTRLGHECQDLLSLCNDMHVCTD